MPPESTESDFVLPGGVDEDGNPVIVDADGAIVASASWPMVDEDGNPVAMTAARLRRRRRKLRLPSIPGDPDWDEAKHYRDPGTGEFAKRGKVTPSRLKGLLSDNARVRAEVASEMRDRVEDVHAGKLTEYRRAVRMGNRDRALQLARELRGDTIGPRPRKAGEDRNVWDAANREMAKIIPGARPRRSVDAKDRPESDRHPTAPNRPADVAPGVWQQVEEGMERRWNGDGSFDQRRTENGESSWSRLDRDGNVTTGYGDTPGQNETEPRDDLAKALDLWDAAEGRDRTPDDVFGADTDDESVDIRDITDQRRDEDGNLTGLDNAKDLWQRDPMFHRSQRATRVIDGDDDIIWVDDADRRLTERMTETLLLGLEEEADPLPNQGVRYSNADHVNYSEGDEVDIPLLAVADRGLHGDSAGGFREERPNDVRVIVGEGAPSLEMNSGRGEHIVGGRYRVTSDSEASDGRREVELEYVGPSRRADNWLSSREGRAPEREPMYSRGRWHQTGPRTSSGYPREETRWNEDGSVDRRVEDPMRARRGEGPAKTWERWDADGNYTEGEGDTPEVDELEGRVRDKSGTPSRHAISERLERARSDMGATPEASPTVAARADAPGLGVDRSKVGDPHTALDLPDPTSDTAPDGWERVGPQGGSNPGGLYRLDSADVAANPEDVNPGDRFYVKQTRSVDHARVETATNLLYEAAGVPVPDVHMNPDNTRIASRIIPGDLTDLTTGLRDEEIAANVRRGMVVDAWLANWDVVGAVNDNIVIGPDGTPWRIDAGGGLTYRARGDAKGAAFGDTVGEIDTFRDRGLNPTAANVFGDITDEELRDGALQVAAISPDRIRAIVASVDADPGIADTLIARRKDLIDRFLDGDDPLDRVDTSPEADTTPDVLDPQTISLVDLNEGDRLPVADLTFGRSAGTWTGRGDPVGDDLTVREVERFDDGSAIAIAVDGDGNEFRVAGDPSVSAVGGDLPVERLDTPDVPEVRGEVRPRNVESWEPGDRIRLGDLYEAWYDADLEGNPADVAASEEVFRSRFLSDVDPDEMVEVVSVGRPDSNGDRSVTFRADDGTTDWDFFSPTRELDVERPSDTPEPDATPDATPDIPAATRVVPPVSEWAIGDTFSVREAYEQYAEHDHNTFEAFATVFFAGRDPDEQFTITEIDDTLGEMLRVEFEAADGTRDYQFFRDRASDPIEGDTPEPDVIPEPDAASSRVVGVRVRDIEDLRVGDSFTAGDAQGMFEGEDLPGIDPDVRLTVDSPPTRDRDRWSVAVYDDEGRVTTLELDEDRLDPVPFDLDVHRASRGTPDDATPEVDTPDADTSGRTTTARNLVVGDVLTGQAISDAYYPDRGWTPLVGDERVATDAIRDERFTITGIERERPDAGGDGDYYFTVETADGRRSQFTVYEDTEADRDIETVSSTDRPSLTPDAPDATPDELPSAPLRSPQDWRPGDKIRRGDLFDAWYRRSDGDRDAFYRNLDDQMGLTDATDDTILTVSGVGVPGSDGDIPVNITADGVPSFARMHFSPGRRIPVRRAGDEDTTPEVTTPDESPLPDEPVYENVTLPADQLEVGDIVRRGDLLGSWYRRESDSPDTLERHLDAQFGSSTNDDTELKVTRILDPYESGYREDGDIQVEFEGPNGTGTVHLRPSFDPVPTRRDPEAARRAAAEREAAQERARIRREETGLLLFESADELSTPQERYEGLRAVVQADFDNRDLAPDEQLPTPSAAEQQRVARQLAEDWFNIEAEDGSWRSQVETVGAPAGVSTGRDGTIAENSGTFVVTGTIRDADGRQIGSWTRNVYPTKNKVYHAVFRMNDTVPKRGSELEVGDRVRHEDFSRLPGRGRDLSTIQSISSIGSGRIRIEWEGPDGTVVTTEINATDNIPVALQGTGIGRGFIHGSMARMRDVGVEKVTVGAYSTPSGDWNGVVVWPRLGFEISDHWSPSGSSASRLASRLAGEGYPEVTADAIRAHPEAMRGIGLTIPMEMDLSTLDRWMRTPGSPDTAVVDTDTDRTTRTIAARDLEVGDILSREGIESIVDGRARARWTRPDRDSDWKVESLEAGDSGRVTVEVSDGRGRRLSFVLPRRSAGRDVDVRRTPPEPGSDGIAGEHLRPGDRVHRGDLFNWRDFETDAPSPRGDDDIFTVQEVSAPDSDGDVRITWSDPSGVEFLSYASPEDLERRVFPVERIDPDTPSDTPEPAVPDSDIPEAVYRPQDWELGDTFSLRELYEVSYDRDNYRDADEWIEAYFGDMDPDLRLGITEVRGPDSDGDYHFEFEGEYVLYMTPRTPPTTGVDSTPATPATETRRGDSLRIGDRLSGADISDDLFDGRWQPWDPGEGRNVREYEFEVASVTDAPGGGRRYSLRAVTDEDVDVVEISPAPDGQVRVQPADSPEPAELRSVSDLQVGDRVTADAIADALWPGTSEFDRDAHAGILGRLGGTGSPLTIHSFDGGSDERRLIYVSGDNITDPDGPDGTKLVMVPYDRSVRVDADSDGSAPGGGLVVENVAAGDAFRAGDLAAVEGISGDFDSISDLAPDAAVRVVDVDSDGDQWELILESEGDEFTLFVPRGTELPASGTRSMSPSSGRERVEAEGIEGWYESADDLEGTAAMFDGLRAGLAVERANRGRDLEDLLPLPGADDDDRRRLARRAAESMFNIEAADGSWRSEVSAATVYGGRMSVSGAIVNDDGTAIGEFSRTVPLDPDEPVEHSLFKVYPGNGGRGIGRQFIFGSMEQMREAGYSRVEVDAHSSPDGGWTGAGSWPRFGFEIDEERWSGDYELQDRFEGIGIYEVDADAIRMHPTLTEGLSLSIPMTFDLNDLDYWRSPAARSRLGDWPNPGGGFMDPSDPRSLPGYTPRTGDRSAIVDLQDGDLVAGRELSRLLQDFDIEASDDWGDDAIYRVDSIDEPDEDGDFRVWFTPVPGGEDFSVFVYASDEEGIADVDLLPEGSLPPRPPRTDTSSTLFDLRPGDRVSGSDLRELEDFDTDSPDAFDEYEVVDAPDPDSDGDIHFTFRTPDGDEFQSYVYARELWGEVGLTEAGPEPDSDTTLESPRLRVSGDRRTAGMLEVGDQFTAEDARSAFGSRDGDALARAVDRDSILTVVSVPEDMGTDGRFRVQVEDSSGNRFTVNDPLPGLSRGVRLVERPAESDRGWRTPDGSTLGDPEPRSVMELSDGDWITARAAMGVFSGIDPATPPGRMYRVSGSPSEETASTRGWTGRSVWVHPDGDESRSIRLMEKESSEGATVAARRVVDADTPDAPEIPERDPHPHTRMLSRTAARQAASDGSATTMFTTVVEPTTFSGHKLHIEATNSDQTLDALDRVYDAVKARGLGMKIATPSFHTYAAGTGQEGKGITIYLPRRDTVDEDVDIISRALDGYDPPGRGIAGDDPVDGVPGLWRRYELSPDAPDRDLDSAEYHRYYMPASASAGTPDDGLIPDPDKPRDLYPDRSVPVPEPTPDADITPDELRRRAQAAATAGGRKIRARVGDDRLSRSGLSRGDHVEIEYHNDDFAKITWSDGDGHVKTHRARWERFDGIEASELDAFGDDTDTGTRTADELQAGDVLRMEDIFDTYYSGRDGRGDRSPRTGEVTVLRTEPDPDDSARLRVWTEDSSGRESYFVVQPEDSGKALTVSGSGSGTPDTPVSETVPADDLRVGDRLSGAVIADVLYDGHWTPYERDADGELLSSSSPPLGREEARGLEFTITSITPAADGGEGGLTVLVSDDRGRHYQVRIWDSERYRGITRITGGSTSAPESSEGSTVKTAADLVEGDRVTADAIADALWPGTSDRDRDFHELILGRLGGSGAEVTVDGFEESTPDGRRVIWLSGDGITDPSGKATVSIPEGRPIRSEDALSGPPGSVSRVASEEPTVTTAGDLEIGDRLPAALIPEIGSGLGLREDADDYSWVGDNDWVITAADSGRGIHAGGRVYAVRPADGGDLRMFAVTRDGGGAEARVYRDVDASASGSTPDTPRLSERAAGDVAVGDVLTVEAIHDTLGRSIAALRAGWFDDPDRRLTVTEVRGPDSDGDYRIEFEDADGLTDWVYADRGKFFMVEPPGDEASPDGGTPETPAVTSRLASELEPGDRLTAGEIGEKIYAPHSRFSWWHNPSGADPEHAPDTEWTVLSTGPDPDGDGIRVTVRRVDGGDQSYFIIREGTDTDLDLAAPSVAPEATRAADINVGDEVRWEDVKDSIEGISADRLGDQRILTVLGRSEPDADGLVAVRFRSGDDTFTGFVSGDSELPVRATGSTRYGEGVTEEAVGVPRRVSAIEPGDRFDSSDLSAAGILPTGGNPTDTLTVIDVKEVDGDRRVIHFEGPDGQESAVLVTGDDLDRVVPTSAGPPRVPIWELQPGDRVSLDEDRRVGWIRPVGGEEIEILSVESAPTMTVPDARRIEFRLGSDDTPDSRVVSPDFPSVSVTRPTQESRVDEAIDSDAYQPVLPGAESRSEIEDLIGTYRETRSDEDRDRALQALTTAMAEFVIAGGRTEGADREKFGHARDWAQSRIEALRNAPSRDRLAGRARQLQDRVDSPEPLEGSEARATLLNMVGEASDLSSQYLLLGDMDEAARWDATAADLQAKADELVPPIRPLPYEIERRDVEATSGSGDTIRSRLAGPDLQGIERRGERLAMRADADAVMGILSDGHAYSQHKIGRSRGALAPESRRRTERAMFGDQVGDGADDVMPVYGFFDEPRSARASAQYGPFVFRMRPEMTERTTITFDDSLGSGYRPLFIDELPDASDAELTSAGYGDGWYFEVQVHGGWNLDEVRPVIEHWASNTPGESGYRGASISELWDVARAARDKGFTFWIRPGLVSESRDGIYPPPPEPSPEWVQLVEEMRAEGIDVRLGGGDPVGGTGMPEGGVVGGVSSAPGG